MRKIFHGLAIATAMTLPLQALANADSGLYDPLPPEGSAFVRFLSDAQDKGSEQVKANGKTFDYVSYKDVSSYYVIPQGKVAAEIGTARTDFNAESGKFYTVILTDKKDLRVEADPVNGNQAKAQIIMYNLSEQNDLSLKTADGKVEVVPPLAAGKMSERQINPVKVPLAVYKGGVKIKDLGEVSLDRSSSYSAVVTDENDVQWIRSTTNTTR